MLEYYSKWRVEAHKHVWLSHTLELTPTSQRCPPCPLDRRTKGVSLAPEECAKASCLCPVTAAENCGHASLDACGNHNGKVLDSEVMTNMFKGT
ncbi:hypothetical protein BaRGS_00030275 [Batillaria attramentaria]|uniref:Uncharacterized protein n=1 Tax=Batillaria attramentaria TaxID=370345 RepID=A0ABD0JUL9_9CAEN